MGKINLTNTQIQLAEQLLLSVIKREPVVYYKELGNRISPPIFQRQVGREIGEVSKLCIELELPLLSAKVIGKWSGVAGVGLYGLMAELGIDTEGKSEKEILSDELKKIRECTEWYRLADYLDLDLDLPRPHGNDVLENESNISNDEQDILDTVEVMIQITDEDREVITTQFSESDVEEYINQNDLSTARVKRQREVLERVCNTKIPDDLKKLYSYRCQICGLGENDTYGYRIVEAHHIIPFSESLNNDSSNIIIICPNHHRLFHKANPSFDRKKKIFIYTDGHSEEIKLNFHL